MKFAEITLKHAAIAVYIVKKTMITVTLSNFKAKLKVSP